MKAQELLKKIQLPELSKERIQTLNQHRRFQRIIHFFENCALCKNPLRFVYFRQQAGAITERAHCDACEKSTNTRSYKIH